MILDIITAALIVIPMAIGMAKGVVYIAARALGWIGALAAAFFLNPLVSKGLGGSFVGEIVYDSLEEKFAGPTQTVEKATEDVPQIIGNGINAAASETADALVQTMGGLIISVMSFVAVALILRLVATIIIRTSSKKGVGSIPVIGRLNKLAGMLVGGIEGLLLAFLFLAALIPIMNMAPPETAESIADGLRYSYLAGPLYDGNLLTVAASFK